ncbi:hypothetical protein [Neobacillus dielmonensis]|uniref:hypothetical protein n=1 Tax=Neobacillus dielmonensis TaxID=1347369 RepID=UPI0005A62913|nr:hypothetical protein [Neobacillus dielmonensis]
MFDPTAFDNMKVVIEGALYDLDLSGEIIITDRNDWLNLAKLSRLFTISFQLRGEGHSKITAKLELESTLNNLAAELLPDSHREQLAGCFVKLHYFLEHKNDLEKFTEIERLLMENWGSTRKITQTIQYNPLMLSKKIKNVITIDFQRLVSEDQLDDLVELTALVCTTLQELDNLIFD